MNKKYTSIDEQIAILKNRGLIINDNELAKKFLLFNNYYRISGYTLTLRSNDLFKENVSLQDVINIYEFDAELRILLFRIITSIEVNIRSVYAHIFSQKYGPIGYLNAENFNFDGTRLTYESIFDKINTLVEKNTKNEIYLQHFREKDEDIPIWAYIEQFTLSDLSRLYSVTDREVQTAIAETFNFHTNNSNRILETYLKCLVVVRNICAHEGRLYDKQFKTKPSLNKKEKKLLLLSADGTPDNSKLIGFILNIKRLADEKQWLIFKNNLIENYSNYKIDMTYYGFNANWKDWL